MALIKNKRLIDNKIDKNVLINNLTDGQIFLVNDLIDGYNCPTYYIDAVKSPITKPLFKFLLLHPDETVKEDVTEYVILGSGNYSENYQQGQRKSLNISLLNNETGKDGVSKWFPSPTRNIWYGTKFRLDLGIMDEQDVYWFQTGIFAIASFEMSNDNEKTITLNMLDKFALLDGTIGGTNESSIKIPVGTTIYDAVHKLLWLDNGVINRIDHKPFILPTKYMNVETAYTIIKDSNNSIGDILIDIADMISCDVYYDNFGSLVFESGLDNIASINNPIIWNFDNNDFERLDSSISGRSEKYVNKVTVIGSNVNGKLFKGVAVNENPSSSFNIKLNPINVLIIEDDNIFSDQLAQDRALYELYKKTILCTAINFNSVFIPHLTVKKIVSWSNAYYGFNNTTFLIQSISVVLDSSCNMNIKMANTSELPL